MKAAILVPELEELFAEPWPEEARAVLPAAGVEVGEATPIWISILAWAALAAIGELHEAADPEPEVAKCFDRLRLREVVAEALEAVGVSAERRWQTAARVRASFAHARFGAEARPEAGRKSAAPFSWLHDADVAWLIGVHEHEGARYFDKSSFERLLWWMSLSELLSIVGVDGARRAELISALERRLAARSRAAAKAGYRVEALLFEGE
jgi:hypothetical protein